MPVLIDCCGGGIHRRVTGGKVRLFEEPRQDAMTGPKCAAVKHFYRFSLSAELTTRERVEASLLFIVSF